MMVLEYFLTPVVVEMIDGSALEYAEACGRNTGNCRIYSDSRDACNSGKNPEYQNGIKT